MNWSQIWTVLWLRWRLTRNQWSRGGKVNVAVTAFFVIAGAVIGLLGGVLGVVAGVVVLGSASSTVTVLVWDGMVCIFLFLWMMGVLVEVQRPEAIDLSRLLHLPVSLKGIFVVNYLASHVSLSLILFLPGMLGISIGLVFSKGAAFLWLLPLVLSVIFLVTAWTYCLRGWLISLMVNQRRRRTVVVAITMGIMLMAQLPNLYINVFGRGHLVNSKAKPGSTEFILPPAFLAAHNYVPFLWAGNGAMGLMAHNPWPAIWGTLGAFALGALGLRRSYTATMRFYQGEEKAKPVKPQAAPQSNAARKSTWVEKTLPVVSQETSTLALAFLRSFTRAPEMKMGLVMSFFMPVVLCGTLLVQGLKAPPEAMYLPFIATGAVAFQFMGLVQSLFNQFGFDREGFRALVLLPTPRRKILLAKNLAFVPLVGVTTFLFVSIVAVLVGLPALDLLAAGCQFVVGFLLLSGVGNITSILFPYRIALGSLKPTKMPGATKIAVALLSGVCFPLFMAPLFIPPGLAFLASNYAGWPESPVNLFCSILLAAAIAWPYWMSLEALGRMLQKREKDILQVVTTEVE